MNRFKIMIHLGVSGERDTGGDIWKNSKRGELNSWKTLIPALTGEIIKE